MTTPRLARIYVYPIKSLDPVEVSTATVSPTGLLENDRTFAIFEGSGDIINAKQEPQLHQVHARIDLPSLTASFRIHARAGENSFHLNDERTAIGTWLSAFFGRPVKLLSDTHLGFADDWTATGPTLVSTASLEEAASWFESMSVDELRRRLRANLEIDGVPPFWEDQLYGPTEGDLVRFRLGTVELFGKNSCQRCPVPMADVESGEKTPHFAKILTEGRQSTLQPWAHKNRFDHYYRFAVNTIPADIAPDARLTVGDELIILGPHRLA